MTTVLGFPVPSELQALVTSGVWLSEDWKVAFLDRSGIHERLWDISFITPGRMEAWIDEKDLEALGEDSPPEDFHDLRKKGKRLRYALEPLQGIYGKPSEKMVEFLKAVQDDLGDHQDLIVAAGLMHELGTAGGLPPRAIFSMGSMAERHLGDAAEMRADFLGSRQLRALKGGKPWKRLRRKMKKRARG